MRAPVRTATGAAAMGIAALALGARYLPVTNHVVLVAAVLSPYLMLTALPSAILFALGRRWMAAAVACGLVVAAVVVELPLYVGSKHGPHSTSLRVMTANLGLGQADARSLLGSAREHADVVVLQELTPRAAMRLSGAGMDVAFPYRAVKARDEAAGVGVWSRYPLTDAARVTGYVMPLRTIRVQLGGVVDPTIVVAHMTGPWPAPIDRWRADFARLPATLADMARAAGDGAVIVAGDFNSTFDERPFRELLRDGYRDAAEQAGAGLTPTYPANRRMPPFLSIDHVLTRNCSASSVATAPLPGSDHRALIATVEIR